MGRIKILTPEQLKENHRLCSLKYASNNRERIRAYANDHYLKNKDTILAKRKARRQRLKAEEADKAKHILE